MGIYNDKEEMKTILSHLWEKIFNTPEIVNSVSGEKLVVRFRYSDLKTDLYIDLSKDTPTFYWDPDHDVKIDVDMILSSETSHKFWMQDLNVPLAIASRKIIAKGSIQKALKLIPALKPAFPMYPEVLTQLGRENLLIKKKKRKKKKKWGVTLFNRLKKKRVNLESIPSFPMFYSEELTKEKKGKKSREKRTVTELDILKVMCTIRAFETHCSQAFRKGDIPTEAIHLSIGQEAIAAGVCLNLRETDYINTTHRGHGHIIAKGADLNRMMAELYGKFDGLCEGKGGSMHVTDRSLGILGANGIVGAGYLLAMGAGFSIKYEKRNDISVVFAGDGSVNQGMFHEAMNMIALFDLPVLIIIENNLYGEFTPVERHSAQTELFKRIQAYNIESCRINGNDAAAVFKEVGAIIQKMREDGKPRAVELMTYRWHGHMEGEPELYRTTKEKEKYKKEDPIQQYKNELLKNKITVTSKEILEKMDQEIEKTIAQSVAFAKKSPAPDISELCTKIYFPDNRSLFEGDFPEITDGKEMSVAQAINQALAEEMERDGNVFLWGEDVTLGGYFSVTEGLVDKFGTGRIIDTPISENGIIGGAIGAAMTGMRPVSEILFGDFLTCCMDPILNQAAKLRYMTGGQVSIPLTIRTPVGSGIGMSAQHSQSMERFFFGIPGLIVAAPSDAYTAKGLLKSAIRSNNPVIFFEHKLLYANSGLTPVGEYTLPLGKARIVKKGDDLTIVTHLLGVSAAMDAARLLSKIGIDVEIIDLLTLYPLDTKTVLDSIAKTGLLVTIEEGTFTGGIGSEVIARISTAGFNLLKRAPLRIAAPECPVPYAKNLENEMMPNPQKIAELIEKMVI